VRRTDYVYSSLQFKHHYCLVYVKVTLVGEKPSTLPFLLLLFSLQLAGISVSHQHLQLDQHVPGSLGYFP